MGGLFGSNRLGSTSLTEVAVFGYRAGKNAIEYARKLKKNLDESNFENHYIRFFGLLNNTGKQKAYNLKLRLAEKIMGLHWCS